MVDISLITKPLSKVKNLKSMINGGALVTTGFCLFDFAKVPEAFSLDYNANGEKVEGTNWKSGLKEIAKSAIKCAGYCVVPALITAAAAGAGPVLAALAGISAFGSSFALTSMFEKFLPSEPDLVAQACKEKAENDETMKQLEMMA